MNTDNEVFLYNSEFKILNKVKDQSNISSLTLLMSDSSFYKKMADLIDVSGEPDYTSFNDIEMIYLFVHQRKDLNENKDRGENTKKEYLRDLLIFYKQLLEQASELEIALENNISNYQIIKTLTHRNLRKYQEWIKEAPLGKGGKPYSVATLNRKMVVLKGFFSFLYENNYISTPLHKKMLSSNVRSIDRPNKELSSVEVILLLDYFRDHPIIFGLISVLTTTGIRIQELCKVRVCDLTYIEGEYWLTVIGKRNKIREVLIHPPVLEAIRNFRIRRRQGLKLDGSDYSPLFTTAKGKAYNYKYLSNYLTKKINQANLDFIKLRKTPITCHTFRHAYALISADEGADLLTIMEALGHSDIKTTMIYLQRKMARKRHAAHSWKESEVLKRI
ncbi:MULTISPECIES: tyrosine-type recombinase/integrase [Bacillota]|uniref:tyrosine-type recombinase/integrase n=1 Tax=Bacillota TaxID=1239 RepID=UPI0039EFF9B7